MEPKNPHFATKPTDPKDVSWGLTTADTCWKRGERSEALKWLRRAVEAASEAEQDERALELAKLAADLATQIGSRMPPPAPSTPSVVPAPPPLTASVAPPAPVARVVASVLPPPPSLSPSRFPPAAARGPAAPKAPGVARPSEAPGAPRAPLGKATAPIRPSVKEPAPAAKKADRRSVTNEAVRGRASSPAIETEKASAPVPRKKSASRVDKTELPARPSLADEIDAWPTEVLGGQDVPDGLNASLPESTDKAASAEPAPSLRTSQALRVVLWRASDGSVRVAAHDANGAAKATGLAATLVAASPDDDLLTLFTKR